MSGVRRLCVICVIVLLACSGCATYSQNGAPSYSFAQLKTIGERYLAAGDNALALKYLIEAEQKRSNVASLQYDLGLAYSARQMEGRAVKHLKKAVALKPDYAEALNALGVLYAKQGKPHQAQRAFEQALAIPTYATPFYAFYNIGLLDEQHHDWQGALQQYRKAVAVQADYAPAYYRMGLILEKLNHPYKARHAYAQAFQNAPKLAQAYFHYGQLSYRLGDVEAAVAALRHAIQLAPYSNMAAAARKTLHAATAGKGS